MTESLSILKGMRGCQKGVMGLKVYISRISLKFVCIIEE